VFEVILDDQTVKKHFCPHVDHGYACSWRHLRRLISYTVSMKLLLTKRACILRKYSLFPLLLNRTNVSSDQAGSAQVTELLNRYFDVRKLS